MFFFVIGAIQIRDDDDDDDDDDDFLGFIVVKLIRFFHWALQLLTLNVMNSYRVKLMM